MKSVKSRREYYLENGKKKSFLSLIFSSDIIGSLNFGMKTYVIKSEDFFDAVEILMNYLSGIKTMHLLDTQMKGLDCGENQDFREVLKGVLQNQNIGKDIIFQLYDSLYSQLEIADLIVYTDEEFEEFKKLREILVRVLDELSQEIKEENQKSNSGNQPGDTE